MIYWEAINDACRRGFRFFDFGEVAEGRPELARYKSKWGSEPVRLYRYYYPAHRDLEVGVVEPRRYPKLLAQAVWLRLPLTATAWVGDRIYARLRLNDNIGAIDLRPDISVIICTQNRASSLQVTLEHLVAADRDGIRAEVIIVDNAGHDNDKKPKRRSRFNGIAKELCELYAQS